jgi:hypothetical protein
VFYLITRLRFAYFHCLINNIKEIRTGLGLYREQAARFFWLNMGVGFCFLVVMAIGLPFIIGVCEAFKGRMRVGSSDWGLLLTLILPLIPIILS